MWASVGTLAREETPVKRTLMLALASVCLLLPSLALAGETLILWRTSALNTYSGYVDSAVVRVNGTNTQCDTTVAIPFASLMAPSVIQRLGAVGDSAAVAMLAIHPSSSTALAEGVDSFYVAIQVSSNGSNWLTVLPNQSHVVAGVAVNAIAIGEGLNEESGESNSGHIIFRAKGVGATLAVAPTQTEVYQWPLVRFIVGGDADFKGEFVAKLITYGN